MDQKTQEKLDILGLGDCTNDFSVNQVNLLFDKLIKKSKDRFLLFLLNDILNMTGNDPVGKISDFVITRQDLIKINGEDFLNKHKQSLLKSGYDLDKDFRYKQRKAVKSYITTVFKGILARLDYKIQYIKTSTTNGDGKKVDLRKYKVEKISYYI